MFAKDGGGLHFIVAGFDWATTDLHNLMYHNLMEKYELLELYKPSIVNLDIRIEKWNKEVEQFLSYNNFLTKHINGK